MHFSAFRISLIFMVLFMIFTFSEKDSFGEYSDNSEHNKNTISNHKKKKKESHSKDILRKKTDGSGRLEKSKTKEDLGKLAKSVILLFGLIFFVYICKEPSTSPEQDSQQVSTSFSKTNNNPISSDERISKKRDGRQGTTVNGYLLDGRVSDDLT